MPSKCQPIRCLDQDCWHKFINWIANSEDPDQLASDAKWSGSTLFAKAGYILVQFYFCNRMPSKCQPIRCLDQDCWHKFINWIANSEDPDQLASEANWSGSTLFAKAGYILVQFYFCKISFTCAKPHPYFWCTEWVQSQTCSVQTGVPLPHQWNIIVKQITMIKCCDETNHCFYCDETN